MKLLSSLFLFFSFLTNISGLNITEPKPLYSIQAVNLTFNPYTISGEQRVILHPNASIKYDEKRNRIDIFQKNYEDIRINLVGTLFYGPTTNRTFFPNLQTIIIPNKTYSNVISMSVNNSTKLFAVTIRPWQLSIQYDFANKILKLMDPKPDKIFKIINVFYYEYVNNTNYRYPALRNDSSPNIISTDIFPNTEIILPNDTDIVFPNNTEITFPNTEIILPNNTNIVFPNNTEIILPNNTNIVFPNNTEIILPNNTNIVFPNNTEIILTNNTEIIIPNTDIPTENPQFPIHPTDPLPPEEIKTVIVENTNDKFEGTVLTEKQFWTLVGGLGGGLCLISLMIYCIRKERKKINDLIFRNLERNTTV